MKKKPKGMGFGIALGAALGAALHHQHETRKLRQQS